LFRSRRGVSRTDRRGRLVPARRRAGRRAVDTRGMVGTSVRVAAPSLRWCRRRPGCWRLCCRGRCRPRGLPLRARNDFRSVASDRCACEWLCHRGDRLPDPCARSLDRLAARGPGGARPHNVNAYDAPLTTLNAVLARIDLRGRVDDARRLLPRAHVDVDAATSVVRPVVEGVRDRGREAVLDYTEQFDKVRLDDVRVPAAALQAALAGLDPDVRAALEAAIDRTQRVHRAQRRTDVSVQVDTGAVVTERWVPVGRVGLYVPGGLVAYPSS